MKALHFMSCNVTEFGPGSHWRVEVLNSSPSAPFGAGERNSGMKQLLQTDWMETRTIASGLPTIITICLFNGRKQK